jgi:hypothetical protein
MCGVLPRKVSLPCHAIGCLNQDVSRRMFAVLAHGFSINRGVYHRNGKSPDAVAFNGVPEE